MSTNDRLHEWKVGDRVTAGWLNQLRNRVIQRVRGGKKVSVKMAGDRLTVGRVRNQIIPWIQPGGGATLLEVAIAKAIAVPGDAVGPEEEEKYGEFGAHLKCHPVTGQGGVDTSQYLVVFPNHGHNVSEFKDGDIQIYTGQVPPVFTAFGGGQGLTLVFGEALSFVAAPDNEDLCPDVQQDPIGACIIGTSCIEDTQENCVQAGGTYAGDGTNCASQTGACCHPDFTCTETTQADCADDWQGPGSLCTVCPTGAPTGACCNFNVPNTCWILTQAECEAGSPAAVYLGDDTSCTNCTPIPQACCFEGSLCLYLTPGDCAGQGGIVWNAWDCSGDPCP